MQEQIMKLELIAVCASDIEKAEFIGIEGWETVNCAALLHMLRRY
jgi:hypothetical protein